MDFELSVPQSLTNRQPTWKKLKRAKTTLEMQHTIYGCDPSIERRRPAAPPRRRRRKRATKCRQKRLEVNPNQAENGRRTKCGKPKCNWNGSLTARRPTILSKHRLRGPKVAFCIFVHLQSHFKCADIIFASSGRTIRPVCFVRLLIHLSSSAVQFQNLSLKLNWFFESEKTLESSAISVTSWELRKRKPKQKRDGTWSDKANHKKPKKVCVWLITRKSTKTRAVRSVCFFISFCSDEFVKRFLKRYACKSGKESGQEGQKRVDLNWMGKGDVDDRKVLNYVAECRWSGSDS